MGSVVTVMNMKGGVGKTTVAMHLAGALSRYNLGKKRNVLAIDYDPQFNLSQALLPAKRYFEAEENKKTTLSILIEDDSKLDPFKIQVPGNHKPPPVEDLTSQIYKETPNLGRLDLIPSTLDLMYVALGEANAKTKPMEERFTKFIEAARKLYDVIFVDCHPAGSIFTQTSLQNSDHVLIPVAPQRYSLRGIGLMLEFIEAKAISGKPATPHILFNSAPRRGTTVEEQQIRGHKDFSEFCLPVNLKKYKAFAEPEGGRGFVWTSGKPYSTEALLNLLTVSRTFTKRTGI